MNNLPHWHTITDEYYVNLIPKVRQAIREKRRGKLSRGVLLNQDKSPAHRSCVAIAVIPNAEFPKLKEHLRGIRSADDNEVMSAVDEWLETQRSEFLGLKHFNTVIPSV